MNTHPNSAVVAAIGKRFEAWQAENAAKIRKAEKLLKAKRRNLTVRKQVPA
jgi:hypothetical protein